MPQRYGPFPIHLTLFTHMFLHGGWAHLLGNLWFLLVFGGHVERALRPGLFLAGYVACGLAAGLAQVLIDPHSYLPCLGASGAISGVMGAYLFLHPLSKLRLWLVIWVVRLPAALVLGFWFLGQYLSAVAVHSAGGPHAGTAYAVHVGGFLAGLVFIACLWVYVHSREDADSSVAAAPPLRRAALRERPAADGLGHFLPPPGQGRAGGAEHPWR